MMEQGSLPRNSSASTSDWIGQVKGRVIYAYDLSTLISETGESSSLQGGFRAGTAGGWPAWLTFWT